MKKIVVLVLIVVFVVSSISCKQPNEYAYLEEDEYYLYKGGELLFGSEQFIMNNYNFDSIGIPEYDGINLETKRGVKIGSTNMEFFDAYRGYACFVYFGENSYLMSTITKSLLTSKSKSGEMTKIKFTSHIVGEKIFDLNEFIEYSEYDFEQRGTYEADPNPNDNYDIYWIVFILDSEKVVEISIKKE